MLLVPIVPRLAWSEFVVIRLLRRWTAVRATEGKALPSMVALAKEMGEGPEVAVALHSLFQLTESCLGRPLRAECCCSRELSSDEAAVLRLIAAAPSRSPANGSSAIPHGLPGALSWAAKAAAMALGIESKAEEAQPGGCPFGCK
jgi:hypothetical protein